MQKNTAQEEAIKHKDGPMILIACPGSGKTTTLLRRIEYLLKSIKAENILMVTFTKAAATEMSQRFEKLVGENPGVTFCTIHSLCYRILYNYMPNMPQILSEHDIREFLMNLVKKNKKINDRKEFVNDLILDITFLKNDRIDLKDFKPKSTAEKSYFDKLYLAYEKFKENNRCMDMDDLLLLTYNFLLNNNNVLELLRNHYQYIQVDEYQDINQIQRDLLYLLAGEKQNLVVVGDDDQAIYGFRGARPSIMLDFKKDFPDAKEIFMSTNYRSAKGIITVADRLIGFNFLRFKKDFEAFHQNKGHVETNCVNNRPDEMIQVMKKIKVLQNHGVNLNDIAILYRTNNQSMMVAENCIKNRIPFKTTENVTSKYHHWLFFDLYSYHRLAEGTGNKMDLLRVINHPMRFLFGDDFIKYGLDKQKMKDVAASQLSKELWQINKMIEEIDNLFSFLDLIKEQPPYETMILMDSRLRFRSYIKEYAEMRNLDPSELLELWDEFKKEAKEKKSWAAWEYSIRIFEQELKIQKQQQNGITLSTMHKAKGLEWEHVFLIDCIKHYHPYNKAKGLIQFEEERRLFYVAMTRAKQYLYIYYYKYRGKNRTEPSEYIKQARL